MLDITRSLGNLGGDIMSENKKFDSHNYRRILPFLSDYIDRHEKKIVKLCDDLGINRATFYNKLYGDKFDFEFVVKLCNYFGIKLSLVI